MIDNNLTVSEKDFVSDNTNEIIKKIQEGIDEAVAGKISPADEFLKQLSEIYGK